MHFSTVAGISPSAVPTTLPIRLEQSSSPTSTMLKLVVLLPATLALLFPFVLLAEAYAADPAVRLALWARPQAMLQLGFGLAFWGVLFAWPLKRLLDELKRRRVVEIDETRVTIRDTGIFRTTARTLPLASFSGVVHHVRASLSGLRHELILAHPEREHSVLLHFADRIPQAEIERVATLLGQCEVPTRMIYPLAGRRTTVTQTPNAAGYARAA